jgi:hypothetical protein
MSVITKEELTSARKYAVKVIDFEPVSFKKEFIMICSIGLNIGFLVGILLV